MNHWGGFDICHLDLDGPVTRGLAESVRVSPSNGGFFRVEIVYWSESDRVSVGCWAGSGMYAGTGDDQYSFESISIETGVGPQEDVTRDIVFVDIGARGGIQPQLRMGAGRLKFVLVEADMAEAARLRNQVAQFDATVIEAALWHTRGRKALNLTTVRGCSSLLEPDANTLSVFPVANWFRVEQTVEVECLTFASLVEAGSVPCPDFMKIDVQGAEFEVLVGCGNVLDTCLGIELECHLRPIYKSEKTASDIIALLAGCGLRLVKFEPQNVEGFGGEIVEFNAWFLREVSPAGEAVYHVEEKLRIMKSLWAIATEFSQSPIEFR